MCVFILSIFQLFFKYKNFINRAYIIWILSLKMTEFDPINGGGCFFVLGIFMILCKRDVVLFNKSSPDYWYKWYFFSVIFIILKTLWNIHLIH